MHRCLFIIADRFAISPLDGDLRVRPGVELDREEMEVYNLTICATDAGSIPLQTRVRKKLSIFTDFLKVKSVMVGPTRFSE